MAQIFSKENPNGLNELIIDMTPRHEPYDRQRGFGREVLRNVYYRIEVKNYTYTFANYGGKYEREAQQGRENTCKYFDEIVAILQAAGWTLATEKWRNEHSGSCPQLIKGNQKLYCHPQSISGCVKADEVDDIARLFTKAKTFSHYHTDDYRDVIVTTDTADEMKLYHQTYDATANHVLEELTTTKRRNLYKNENDVWLRLFERLSIDTKRAGKIYNFDHVEQAYANDIIQKAKADGWLVEAKGRNNSHLIRWINKAEQRKMEFTTQK
ncbi:MAG: hypothetical protein J5732_02760 [Bacteroidaceae bacterium]|nr:hypothetical protein [Bacteroidaceae bacterium]